MSAIFNLNLNLRRVINTSDSESDSDRPVPHTLDPHESTNVNVEMNNINVTKYFNDFCPSSSTEISTANDLKSRAQNAGEEKCEEQKNEEDTDEKLTPACSSSNKLESTLNSDDKLTLEQKQDVAFTLFARDIHEARNQEDIKFIFNHITDSSLLTLDAKCLLLKQEIEVDDFPGCRDPQQTIFLIGLVLKWTSKERYNLQQPQLNELISLRTIVHRAYVESILRVLSSTDVKLINTVLDEFLKNMDMSFYSKYSAIMKIWDHLVCLKKDRSGAMIMVKCLVEAIMRCRRFSSWEQYNLLGAPDDQLHNSKYATWVQDKYKYDKKIVQYFRKCIFDLPDSQVPPEVKNRLAKDINVVIVNI